MIPFDLLASRRKEEEKRERKIAREKMGFLCKCSIVWIFIGFSMVFLANVNSSWKTHFRGRSLWLWPMQLMKMRFQTVNLRNWKCGNDCFVCRMCYVCEAPATGRMITSGIPTSKEVLNRVSFGIRLIESEWVCVSRWTTQPATRSEAVRSHTKRQPLANPRLEIPHKNVSHQNEMPAPCQRHSMHLWHIPRILL